jgi:hypothetical protein
MNECLFIQYWWNNAQRGGNQHMHRKTCLGATTVAINPKWTGLGSNLGMCSEKRVINHLSCGMASAVCGERQYYSLLWCGGVYLSVWLSTFEKNQLPPLTGQKLKAAVVSKMLVPIHPARWQYILEDHSLATSHEVTTSNTFCNNVTKNWNFKCWILCVMASVLYRC